jgi:hypothetical protein
VLLAHLSPWLPSQCPASPSTKLRSCGTKTQGSLCMCPTEAAGKEGGPPGPHPGPAAAPASYVGLETLGSASAVSSLSPAWGTSGWRLHDSSPGRLRPRPAAPALLSTCRLPGNTCDPSRSGPALRPQARLAEQGQADPRPILSWGATQPKRQGCGIRLGRGSPPPKLHRTQQQ